MHPSFDAARVEKPASVIGETHVKKSLSPPSQTLLQETYYKNLSALGIAADKTCLHSAGSQKQQSSSQPTIKKHHVPGGIFDE